MTHPEFQVCDNDLSAAALELYRSDPMLAVDTETMGLLPHRDRLCVVQLCNRAGQVVLIRLAQGVHTAPQLQHLMEDPGVEKVFHFARFDLAMLKHHLNIQVSPTFCTKIASKIGRTYTNRHSLRELVQEFLGLELDKKAQSSDWGAIQDLSADQLDYAANDVRYLLPVRERLEAMLRREGRWDLTQRCFEHLPTLIDLDLQGFTNVFEHQ